MKKKAILFLSVVICMLMFLTACSAKIGNSTVKEDIEPVLSKSFSDDTLDMTNWAVTLTAGDWVVKDSSASKLTKSDVVVTLYIDEAKIRGKGQMGNPFVATQQ